MERLSNGHVGVALGEVGARRMLEADGIFRISGEASTAYHALLSTTTRFALLTTTSSKKPLSALLGIQTLTLAPTPTRRRRYPPCGVRCCGLPRRRRQWRAAQTPTCSPHASSSSTAGE